jgi:hypothetical protein
MRPESRPVPERADEQTDRKVDSRRQGEPGRALRPALVAAGVLLACVTIAASDAVPIEADPQPRPSPQAPAVR